MQIKSAGIEAFLKAPGDQIEAVLIFGRDQGLVRERSKALEAGVLQGDENPFRRLEMSEGELKGAPGALYDEAAAIAMLGGRKFIRLRTSADIATAALKTYLDAREAGSVRPDALIVIEAGDLRSGQGLRKLAETSPLIAAIACYPDDAEDLDTLIDTAMREAQMTIAPEAKAALTDRLGADRGVSRQEIDKLLTYCGAGTGEARPITADDVLKLVGDASAAELDRLIDAVFIGDLKETARLSARLRLAGTAPVRILRAVGFHLDRLTAAQDGGGRAMFGYAAQAARRHLGRWPTRRIARAQRTILDAEIQCKTTGMPAEEICERTLLGLARGARQAPAA